MNILDWKLLVSFFVFITYLFSLVLPDGYSYGPALLLLVFIVFSFRLRYLNQLDSLGKILVFSFLLYFFNLAFDILYHDMPLSEFDRPSRLLFALGVMFLLIQFPPRSKAFWYGIALGAIAAGLAAIWHKFFVGVVRVGVHMSPIQFGNLAMLMGLMSLLGAVARIEAGYARILLFVAFALGFFASLLSGSRGGWIGFPIIVLFILRCYSESRIDAIKKMVLPSALIIAAVLTMPQLGVKDRIEHAINDVEQYFKHHLTHTSVGARLELWRAGMIMFKDKPILGWGEQGYAEEKARLADAKIVGNSIRYNSHLHNEFVDALVIRGGVGLLVILLFYLLPLMKIFSLLREPSLKKEKVYLVAMAVVIFSYIDFGLSQVFWAHNSGAMFYTFTMVILYSLYIKEKRGAES